LYNKHLNDPQYWKADINIMDELYPFAAWLQELFKRKEINENEHICYSADHLLYLFPLHYLKVNGDCLIEKCTVSRVHNAGHLISMLKDQSAQPESILVVEVPSTDDLEDPETIKAFEYTYKKLNAMWDGDTSILQREEATIGEFVANCKENLLVHFATHGFFPKDDNPFKNSGLLLSDDGEPPTLHVNDPNYKYDQDGYHLLSPERLLVDYKGFRADNTHVSLQACVAGYAREGIAGDALGIEWAFFQKGTTSMVSTFWNIDVQNANNFYDHFYEGWLKGGLSKAKAHQKALLGLRKVKNPGFMPQEFYWAGYGLIGDWR
jgi:CHAT domain-containing protein